MKQRQHRITVLAVWAFALLGIGGLLEFMVVNSCHVECYGMLFELLLPAGLAIIGILIGIVSWSIAVRDAIAHRDRASAMLLTIGLALSIGTIVYIAAAVLVREGAPLTSSNVLISFIPLGWNIPLYAAPALFALLYTRVRDGRTSRLSALGILPAALVIVLLIAFPPWSAFNPADRPPVLIVGGPVSAADCVHGIYPAILVRNSGGGTLRWTAKITLPTAVSIQPSGGSISPGESQTVMLVGDYLPTPDTGQGINVDIVSNGGDQSVYVTCAAPSSVLRVTPSTITTSWQDITLPAITVTNTGQNDALWSATTTQLGLTISPQSGSLHPGQSQSVGVYNQGEFGSSVCGTAGHPPFNILFYGGPQPLTVTVTVTCP